MPDYKELYLGLFRATEKAINILVEAQHTVSSAFISPFPSATSRMLLFAIP